MASIDIDDIRRRVSEAGRVDPASGDYDYDRLASASLVAAFNRIAPHDYGLPTEGLVALEVAAHGGGRLAAHEQGELETAVARAIALVGAAITHPDSDIGKLGSRTMRQSLVYTRPTPTGAIAFLPQRDATLPGTSEETVAERAMTRLTSILPAGPDDAAVSGRLLSLRQPERKAVTEVARVARPMAGLALTLLGQEDVVRSTVTSTQAEDIQDLLRDSDTVATPMRPVLGRLDGMRFSRQMFFLQIEGGRDRQGLIDADLVPKAKSLLDQRVLATLERVVTRYANGRTGRPTYRLVDVEAAPDARGLF